jgi:hypothetical protein
LTESLLGFVLARLDQLERPVFLHRELERFPEEALQALRAEGILRETSKATEIPRPAHLPAGGDLIVRKTSKGLFGVADEDDYFEPVPLTDDDVRQYEVSLPRLADRIRRDNGIDGTGSVSHNGLIPLGQKAIEGMGTADVFLSLPNEDEATFLSRCQRLERSPGSQKVVLLTPRGVPVSPEGRRVLDSAGVIVASLMAAASNGTLALDWDQVLPRPGIGLATEYPKDKHIFQKQGKTWLLVYDGVPKSVGHSVGMAYICHLLQSPGQETHAATLRSAVAGDGDAPLLGSAGEVLDDRALKEYREHLKDLEEEIREAEANHDIGRAEKLKEDFEAITTEIGRATGLGGRSRKAADDRERARQAVSVAIRRALKAIKEEHEPLWRYLSNSLRIGEYLSYEPEQRVTWNA